MFIKGHRTCWKISGRHLQVLTNRYRSRSALAVKAEMLPGAAQPVSTKTMCADDGRAVESYRYIRPVAELAKALAWEALARLRQRFDTPVPRAGGRFLAPPWPEYPVVRTSMKTPRRRFRRGRTNAVRWLAVFAALGGWIARRRGCPRLRSFANIASEVGG